VTEIKQALLCATERKWRWCLLRSMQLTLAITFCAG